LRAQQIAAEIEKRIGEREKSIKSRSRKFEEEKQISKMIYQADVSLLMLVEKS
jgi:hypothetical protein